MRTITTLKKCPCCQNNAEWVEVKTQDIQLWQLACNACGLATHMNEKKITCYEQWNTRVSNDRTKIGWALVLLLSLLISIVTFVLGLSLGMGLD